jgi:archaellum biogenesis ATPase FlaH
LPRANAPQKPRTKTTVLKKETRSEKHGRAKMVILDVAILLPTYCEAENIENLIHTIENLEITSRIIVIDDSSPDGHGKLSKNSRENMET